MSGRDAFRAPGWWSMDFGIYKDTKITERFSLQLRGEAFNVFNHANLYVVGAGAELGTGNFVTACYGCTGSTHDRRNLQVAAKLIFNRIPSISKRAPRGRLFLLVEAPLRCRVVC